MKRFVINTLLFIAPFLSIFVVLICLDPHKVFYDYETYYNEEDSFIAFNREFVVTQIYLKNYEKEKFNAFIFGNSRSRAYDLNEWKSHLPEGTKPFLFDASGEGIIGVKNKLVFLDALGQNIDHVILTVDAKLLNTTENRKGLSFISPTELSGESKTDFHLTYLNALTDGKLALGYLDYSLNRKYRSYMWGYIDDPNTYSHLNAGVIGFAYRKKIDEDSISYYKEKNHTFIHGAHERYSGSASEQEKQCLTEIVEFFKKHNTSYKIVVHPEFNKVPLRNDHLQLLEETFGKENIYNYSGAHEISKDKGNFYDGKHYKMIVGTRIMNEIYGSSKTN